MKARMKKVICEPASIHLSYSSVHLSSRSGVTPSDLSLLVNGAGTVGVDGIEHAPNHGGGP